MELDNLGSAESFTLTATRLPGGKFSVRSGTWNIETVILADQVPELRIRQGQVHVLRPSKVLDPEDQFPNWELGSEVVDDI